MHYSSRVAQLAGTGSDAWNIHFEAEQARSRGEDVIVMSVGDPDFDTPIGVCEAAISAIRSGDTHYTGIKGRLLLREAIAAKAQKQFGVPAEPENVIVLAGTQNALFSAAQCLFEPGDEVITIDPSYVTYDAAIGASGARLVRVATSPHSGFRPDIDAVASAITGKTRGLLFSSPNNPSGVSFTKDELEQLAALAKRHDLWVLSDEVYSDLIFDGEHKSIAALPDMAERTVVLSSLSKSHAMTGWRIGWMIGPAELVEHAERLALCMLYGLPGFIQQAALAALTEGQSETQRMVSTYRSRARAAVSALQHVPKISLRAPESGMFVLADVQKTGLSSSEFCQHLFHEQRVSVLNGTAFGACCDGFVRLSFAVSDADIEEGCQRIGSFCNSLA
ncbi:MAG: pyridoxal phosphate-dependent aminotransferase [Pseudomonadota bacterium]